MSAVAEAVSAPTIEADTLRIASAQELAAVTGDLALAIRAMPANTSRRLYPLLILLAECQAELLRPAVALADPPPQQELPGALEADAQRVAYLLRQLQDVPAPGERAAIVMERTGWSRSKYYRARADALQRRLL